MSYKISKELFEAVMVGYEYISPHNNGIIYYWKDSGGLHNEKVIYPNDFFFKCKEWAWQNNFCIITQYDGPDSGFVQIEDFHDNLLYEFTSDSEQQAVFDACEWILKNKDNK